MRRQVWYTLGFLGCLGVTTVVFADAPGNPVTGRSLSMGDWITVVLTATTAIYGIGTLREQFAEDRRRLSKLEDDFETAMQKTIPDTYVRRDVYDAYQHQHQRTPRVHES